MLSDSRRGSIDSIYLLLTHIENFESGSANALSVVVDDQLLQDLARIEVSQIDQLNIRYAMHCTTISWSLVDILCCCMKDEAQHTIVTPEILAAYISLSTTSALHRDFLYSCRDSLARKVLEVIETKFGAILSSPNTTGTPNLFIQHLYTLRRVLCTRNKTIPQSLFLTGVILNDPTPVACGSYSEVYPASHNGSRIALKRLRHFVPASDFTKEALRWSSLRHPNILELIGIDAETFTPWSCMVSPWMENGNIRDASQLLASQDQRIPYERWTDQSAHAMEYLHASGLIHGDLRGENVLVDSLFNIKISDFGLSIFQDDNSGSMGSHPGGALRSLAPEIFSSEVSIRPTYASDVYAYAFLLIEIWTGRVPFHQFNRWQVLQLILKGTRPSRPDSLLDDTLWDLIQECWAANPEDRPVFAEIAPRIQSLTTTISTPTSSSYVQVIPSISLTREPEPTITESLIDVTVPTPSIPRTPVLSQVPELVNSIPRPISSRPSPSRRRTSWYQRTVPSWMHTIVRSLSS